MTRNLDEIGQDTRVLNFKKIAQISEELSRSLVIAQYMLLDIVELTEQPSYIENLRPKAVATKHNIYIHIDANIYPPKISVHPSQQKAHKYASTYQMVRDVWYSIILKALRKIEPEAIDDAVVLIRYRRKPTRFDPPNFNSKFILDSLVYNGLIKDDAKDDIILILAGIESEQPGTDIFIGKRETFLPLVVEFLAQKREHWGSNP